MVYTGKPSRACATCKKRRIKCDEARPSCGQCIKSKRECTGYKSEADLMFRDETKSIADRVEKIKKANSASPLHGRPDVNVTSEVFVGEFNGVKFLAPKIDPADDAFNAEAAIEEVPREEEEEEDFSRAPATTSLSNIVRAPPSAYSDLAKAYFFNEFILPRETHGFNHLQMLNDMYRSAGASDPISLVTEALSFLSISCRPGQNFLRTEASRAYGRAVHSVARAVADPVRIRRDATLMSISLLSFAETLVSAGGSDPTQRPYFRLSNKEHSIANFHQAWGAHAHGALSIVRMRGIDEMSSSPISLPLMIQARLQNIIRNIFSCEPITDHHEIFDPVLERRLIAGGFESQITMAAIGIRIPDMRCKTLNLVREPMYAGLTAKLKTLLTEIRQLEYELINWSYKFLTVRPETVFGYYYQTTEHVEDERAYPGHVFRYDNILAMNAWNTYRTYRFFNQMMIFNILERLIPPNLITTHPEMMECCGTIRTIAADCCAAVPYALGYLGDLPLSNTPPQGTHVFEPGGRFISTDFLLSKYPTSNTSLAEDVARLKGFHVPSSTSSDNTATGHGPAMSAWYLVWPMHVAQNAVPVDIKMKDWFRGRFRYIYDTYGIAQADLYAKRRYEQYDPTKVERVISPHDFAPPAWEPLQ